MPAMIAPVSLAHDAILASYHPAMMGLWPVDDRRGYRVDGPPGGFVGERFIWA